jgi:hypothetical protein
MSEMHEATPVSHTSTTRPQGRDTRHADRKIVALSHIRSRRVGAFAVKSGQLASVAKVYLAASDCKVIAESRD